MHAVHFGADTPAPGANEGPLISFPTSTVVFCFFERMQYFAE